MSSKLVKKLLNQTNIQSEDNDEEYHSYNESKKRRITQRTKDTTRKITREEAIHGHIQSILRLDNLVHDHTSTLAQNSFTRRSSDQKQAARFKKSGVGISNSRTSSSSFSQRQQEQTFNKEKDKRKKEEEYYSDIARALKKAKKKSKR